MARLRYALAILALLCVTLLVRPETLATSSPYPLPDLEPVQDTPTPRPHGDDYVYPEPVFLVPATSGPTDEPRPTPALVITLVPTDDAPAITPEGLIALRYVSNREGVPIHELAIVRQCRMSFPLLGRRYMAFLISSEDASLPGWELLVDLDDHSVEPDPDAVIQAEADLYSTSYRKLDQGLYDRLASVAEGDEIDIIIWVGGENALSEEEIIQILVERYPEAREAYDRHWPIFLVDDPELAEQIHQDYVELHRQNVSVRIAPLVQFLESRGLDVDTLVSVPSVFISATRELILELCDREDVARMYVETELVEEHDLAAPADWATPVGTSAN